jgi:hypothetical protein
MRQPAVFDRPVHVLRHTTELRLDPPRESRVVDSLLPAQVAGPLRGSAYLATISAVRRQ